MVTLDCGQEIQDDDVVISGFSGRFPMSDNIDEFRDNLFNKVDMVQPIEDETWKNTKYDIPKYAGLLGKREKFDAGYFGIHQKYTHSLDILTRLILEKANEAIFDAGINPQTLQKSNTGVVIGASHSESETTWLYSDWVSGLEFLGHSRALLANRISFWLDSNSSSYAISTMETSGLESITLAYNGIKKGYFDAVLVGTIGLVFLPQMSYLYKQMGLISEDGKTRSFDEEADGYARSDGVSVIFIQKAKHAKRVYAKIVHVAAGFVEKKTDILRPVQDTLVKFLEDFYQKCGVNPTKVSFLEADGSAIKLGDAEELNAMDKVFLKNRKSPLLIGSVKSNMGHANGASSFSAIAKILIAMQTGKIPPNLHYKNPSAAIPALKENRFKVVTENTPWKGGFVAVNSVGLSGVYGHMLLQSYSRKTPKQQHSDGIPRLVTISGRTQEGLQQVLDKLGSMTVDVELIGLLHNIFSESVRNHLYRSYIILPFEEKPIREIQYYNVNTRPVWFVFSGMGSQWPGMGKEIMKLPVCAATIEKCHQVLLQFGLNLKHIITTEDPVIFDTILNSFVGIAAIQLALVDALRMLNITPDGIIGHSVGELGCAYADGCFSLEQMIFAAYYRGLASIQTELIHGSMAAVGLGYQQIRHKLPPEVDVACHNSNSSCTLSGPLESITKYVAELKMEGVFAKAVNVANIAYHSRYIKPAAPALLDALKKIIPEPKARSKRWICTSVPEKDWNTPLAKYCSAEYHTNNLLSPVLFEEGSKYIPKNAVVIEIAPHGLLQAILRRSLDSSCTNIPLTQRNNPNGLQFLLAAFGKIYMAGPVPKLQNIYPPVQFPVSKGTPSISPFVTWDHTFNWHVLDEVLMEKDTGEREITVSLNQAEDRVYADQIIKGKIVMPSFTYLKIVWQTFALLIGKDYTEVPIVFENVVFHQQLEIPTRGSLKLYVMVQRGNGDFEITIKEKLIVSGRIRALETDKDHLHCIPAFTGEVTLSADDVYGEFKLRGCDYGEAFKSIQEVELGKKGCSSKILWSDNWVTFGEALLQLICLKMAEHNQEVIMPASINKIIIDPLKHKTKNEVMEAVYHTEINMAQCGTLELQNITMMTLDSALIQQPNIKLETIKFVPHSNTAVQSIKHFVNLCLQLVLQNSRYLTPSNNVNIIEVNTGNPLVEFMPHIKAVLPHYADVSLKTVTYGSLHEITKEEKANCSLVIVNGSGIFKEAFSLLGHDRGFVLMRMDIQEKGPIDCDFVTVADQHCGSRKIVLLRKGYEANDKKSMVLNPVGDCSTWLSQIKECEPIERLYVATQISPVGVGKIPSFIRQLTTDRQLTHVRCIFTSDLNVTQFSVYKEPFKYIVKQDIIVNVLRDGVWGSFQSIIIDNNASFMTPRILPKLPLLKSFEGASIKYIGINECDRGPNENRIQDKNREKVELMDFSGLTNKEEKIMGLIPACKEFADAEVDQCLWWYVPAKWTLEDAATVPLAYAIAYYAMVLIAKLKERDTVLIHCGWKSVGQACIVIALHYNCTVFTSVATTKQREFIKQKFSQILDEHILNSCDDSFGIFLLRATKGNGVRVIMNMLPGSVIQKSINCLSRYGCMVHLGQTDLLRNNYVGMQTFLKGTSLVAIASNFLTHITPESKKAVHAAVQEGINSGVIQPLHCSVFSKQQIEQAFQTQAELNHIGKVVLSITKECTEGTASSLVKQHGFKCDPHGSYLVTGGHAEQCMDVAEWLVMHGAHQLVIALRSKMVSNLVRRRINLKELYHKAHIALVSTPAATTASNAANLLQEAMSVSEEKLKGIFILPAETSGQDNRLTALTVSQLDNASRSIKSLEHFVCLLSEGSWSTCEARHQDELPALAVHWPESQVEGFALHQSLGCLDKLLTQENPYPIVIVTYNKLAISKGYQLSSLAAFLPPSLKQLENFGKDLCNQDVCIERLQSQIPDTVITEATPKVFIIPGLQGSPREVLLPLAIRLIYPLFCLKLGTKEKAWLAIAQEMVKCIQQEQKTGPYVLVGISWGGALTLEVAKLLEAQGNETRIVLVDGALETLHLILTCLDTSSAAKLQANLLCELLNIRHQKIETELMNLPSWDSRVDRAIKELQTGFTTNKNLIIRAVNVIASRISTLLSYKPKDILLSGSITLIRPISGDQDENCGLTQFFKQSVISHVIEGDHLTILENPFVARNINSIAI